MPRIFGAVLAGVMGAGAVRGAEVLPGVFDLAPLAAAPKNQDTAANCIFATQASATVRYFVFPRPK